MESSYSAFFVYIDTEERKRADNGGGKAALDRLLTIGILPVSYM